MSVGKHFRIFSENAPSLWGDFKEPLSQKGFFELLSFGTFSLQKQRKVRKSCFPLVPFLCSSKGKYTEKESI